MRQTEISDANRAQLGFVAKEKVLKLEREQGVSSLSLVSFRFVACDPFAPLDLYA